LPCPAIGAWLGAFTSPADKFIQVVIMGVPLEV
jgi:hypothetical protein